MKPSLQFKLSVYAASVSGQRAGSPITGRNATALAEGAWLDMQNAVNKMPPDVRAELEQADVEYAEANSMMAVSSGDARPVLPFIPD